MISLKRSWSDLKISFKLFRVPAILCGKVEKPRCFLTPTQQANKTQQRKLMLVREFEISDQSDVICLWEQCNLTRPWNDPKLDLQRKLKGQPDWLLVGVDTNEIIGSIMVGYDGHRGWINYLAVRPDRQRSGIGRALMMEAERRLLGVGCPKINLQIRDDNRDAVAFYESIGFSRDPVASFGKRLIPDAPPADGTDR